MANPWVWGPSPIFLGGINQSASTCTFLGWTEENGPQVNVLPSYEPIMSTLSGSRDPFDEAYQGQKATLQFALTRWNEPMGSNLMDFVNAGTLIGAGTINVPGQATPGEDNAAANGSLMMTEGLAMTVMILAPYTGKAEYGLQLAGMRFPCCKLVDVRMGPLGTKPRIMTLAFNANRFFSPTGGNSSIGDWRFVLWDQNVAGATILNI